MLRLKNIEKNDDRISAEYDPEDSGEFGYVSISAETGTILDSKPSTMDQTFPIYLNHAADALKKLVDSKELPKEKTIMWY